MPWYGHWIWSLPRVLPMDSGARRCQQASASATALPSSVRYSASGRSAILRAIGLRVTSWSHAATYQAFSGWPRTLLVVERLDWSTVIFDLFPVPGGVSYAACQTHEFFLGNLQLPMSIV